MFARHEVTILKSRLAEPRRFIQAVLGPREVGKTTAVVQALRDQPLPFRLFSADDAGGGCEWISRCWTQARLELASSEAPAFVLALDEIQQIPGWSETVKKEWDADTHSETDIRVVLLGSSRAMLARGLSEPLTGRFEEIRMTHWTYPEMRDAFGFSLPQFIFFGGYPGAAALIGDEERWRAFIRATMVDSTINRDILIDSPVSKPALLKQTFELGAQYSGEILSLTKLMGSLRDAGNTTTLAGYLGLLAQSGLLAALPKFSAGKARKRASIPKFQVFNSALRSALLQSTFEQAFADPVLKGRCIGSAVGAFLLSEAFRKRFELLYWREKADEVDYVIRFRGKCAAIEVKSNGERLSKGLSVFTGRFRPEKAVLVGEAGLPVEEFLSMDPLELLS